MIDDAAMQARLRQLIEDDAVGQLRRRDGLMATLGSEDGALKLDWVEAVGRLLADPAKLAEVEAEARDIRSRGIRHIIWAGMGGSILTVRVLRDLGFGGASPDMPRSPEGAATITIHPLDSTDPAALNGIVRALAEAKQLMLPTIPAADATFLRSLLRDVMMVGVSMGMTSEEPITHLTWFTELLRQANLPPSEHLLVMTLPGSFLDAFALEHGAPGRPLQLDGGTGTGGRMSAPATLVFLLPAALYLTGLSAEPGQLRSVLQSAWDEYDLESASSHPADHQFVRLAAALSTASADGACRMLLRMPPGWQMFVSWLEQLMEESLGKGGKGIVVFDDQPLNTLAPAYAQDGMLRVAVVAELLRAARTPAEQVYTLFQPSLASVEPQHRLAALTAGFLGWQLTMALYGYLHRITFAGQPAVENYKARARALRLQPDPLAATSLWHDTVRAGKLTLLAPIGTIPERHEPAIDRPAAAVAQVLRALTSPGAQAGESAGIPLGYLDVTINGVAPTSLLTVLDEQTRIIGNTLLGVPAKPRTAPAAYHSTEQSEMDGPANLVSLRLIARESETCLLGSYTTAFLHAQAVSTWQAMIETGRQCFLLVIDGTLDGAMESLTAFFAQVRQALASGAETEAPGL